MTFTKLIGPCCLLAFAATCQAQWLNLGGMYETSNRMSMWQVEQLPWQSIETIDHGASVTFDGVPLAVVLGQISYPSEGQQQKNPNGFQSPNDYYLAVEFGKGRKAAFAWVDVNRWLKDKAAYVVVKRNKEPIGESGFGLLILDDWSHLQYMPQVEWLRVEPFRGTPGWDFARDRWLELIVRDSEPIRVGQTRSELERFFVEQDARLKGAIRTYSSKKSGFVKVDVEFLEDRIVKISKPYLGMPYCGSACE
jgi:hypothetical protein